MLPIAQDLRVHGLLVAVSGGVDSVVLLDLLWRRYHENTRLCIAHVNYRLRRAADGDEQLVRTLAKHYGLPCFVKRCRKPPAQANVQDWARRQRYDYFQKIAQKHDIHGVAVAHHANDQAETMLWNLLRGTGLGGLTGMVAERRLTETLTLIRPLLEQTRDTIANYATARRIRYRHDRTNTSRKYMRGRIRTELLPRCEELVRGATEHLATLAGRLQRDEATLRHMAEEAWEQIRCDEAPDASRWAKKGFLALPSALRVRIFQLAYAQIAGTSRPLTADHLGKMDRAAWSTGKQYCLPGSFTYRTERESCAIIKGRLHRQGGHDTVPDPRKMNL